MGSVLLDATVLIDFLRGRSDVRDRLLRVRDSGDVAHTCAVPVEETVRGLREGEEERARALFLGLREVPLGTAEGWRAGQWRREFARRGVTLAQGDCLIAAAALAIGARLATANVKDFPMEGLTVEDWGADRTTR
jgi:predicted nucleic acid-binding protein